MYKCLVGVNYLLKVDRLVAVVGKGCILIEVLVCLDYILNRCRGLDDCCTEDAAGKVAAIGDEVDVGVEIALNLLQTLTNLGNVLMLEGLVDA